jgi:hypothetical protein
MKEGAWPHFRDERWLCSQTGYWAVWKIRTRQPPDPPSVRSFGATRGGTPKGGSQDASRESKPSALGIEFGGELWHY